MTCYATRKPAKARVESADQDLEEISLGSPEASARSEQHEAAPPVKDQLPLVQSVLRWWRGHSWRVVCGQVREH